MIGALLAGLGPAARAKPVLVTQTDQGAWYVIDRVFQKQGDCRLVATVFVRRQPVPTNIGQVKAITRVMRVCCGAETYQITSSRFVNPKGKVLYTHQIPDAQQRAIVAHPGSALYRVIRKVCAPGFGEDQ